MFRVRGNAAKNIYKQKAEKQLKDLPAYISGTLLTPILNL